MIRIDSAADVAETLGLLRTLARLSQRAVAEKLGCNPSRVGHYEQGQRRQSVATLIHHLAALGYGLAIVPLDESSPETAPASTLSDQGAVTHTRLGSEDPSGAEAVSEPCGCPVRYERARIVSHGRECCDRVAAERLARHLEVEA